MTIERHKAKLLILKLSERTTANGCSEAEALAAEKKVGELLKTHKLKLRRPRWWLFALLASTVTAQAAPADNPVFKKAAAMYLAGNICGGPDNHRQVFHLTRIGMLQEGISEDTAIDIVAYQSVKIADYLVEHNTTGQFCWNASLAKW